MSIETRQIPQAEACRLADHYRQVLLEDFVPWWENHAVDHECGGFYSCLDRKGQPYATDKYAWMLARGTWMFGRLYNTLRKEPRWLELAQHGAKFLIDHAFNERGDLYFRMTREGKPLADPRDPYSACFAAIAFAELRRATGEPAYWDRAIACYQVVRDSLGQPLNTPLLGYPLRAQFHLHAHDMIRLTVASVLHEIDATDARWSDDLTKSAESIVRHHWRPELGVVLENIAPDGSLMLDLTEGRLVNPGHAIESAWMLMELAIERSDRELLDAAIAITVASLEKSWDEKYGGMRYLLNVDGTPMIPPQADQKLWWPHAEALYALLLGWAATGQKELGVWYQRVHDYAFKNFADPEFGEWYGYLNRDNSVMFTAKTNGWKGFFHLPRVFLRCYLLLSKIKGV